MRAVVMEHLSGGDVDAQAMHASVVVGEAMRSEEQEDVRALVDGKSQAEIDALQADITAQLEAGEGMDVDYWTAVLALLRLASFKEVLRREQQRFKLGRDAEVSVMGVGHMQKQRQLEAERQRLAQARPWRQYSEQDAVEGEFSPEPIARSALPAQNAALVVEAEDDAKQLATERAMVRHRELEALTCKLMNERRSGGTTEHVMPVSFDNEVEWG